MIISASRRTDLPSYYAEWFFNRIREGYVLVRNPMNPHQVGKISLSPDVVDGIVFWTKNPIPMLDWLPELERYSYYFQFTLTAYGRDVERGLPSKNSELIPAFCSLSKRIGRERVVWRYDPIFISEAYGMEYHRKYFRALAARLGEYTETCTISFLDLYRSTARRIQPFGIRTLTADEQAELASCFAEAAKRYGFSINTCAETVDLSRFGISHAHCIDKERLERIGNFKLDVGKDENQREACGCVSSVDIGTYNTCKNGCVYCYANYSQSAVAKQTQGHDPRSPLLFGELGPQDRIKERKMRSCRQDQLTVFDV